MLLTGKRFQMIVHINLTFMSTTRLQLVVVVYTCNRNTWEAEEVDYHRYKVILDTQRIPGHSKLQIETLSEKYENGDRLANKHMGPSSIPRTHKILGISQGFHCCDEHHEAMCVCSLECTVMCGGQRIICRNHSLFLPFGSWGLYSGHFTSYKYLKCEHTPSDSVIPFLDTNPGENKA